MKEIEVEGKILEFPDDMDDTEIARAIEYERGGSMFDVPGQGVLHDVATGVVKGGTDAYYAAKQMLGVGTPQDEQAIRDWRGRGERAGVAGTVGQVGSMLVPGMAAVKGVSMLPRAVAMARAAPVTSGIAGGAALGAAEGALQPTLGDESRLANVAIGAGAGAVGGAALPGAAAAMRRFGRPVKPSEDAAQLMKKGIVPTVGTGAESEAVQFAEELLKPVAMWGRRRARKEVLRESVKRATPPGVAMPEIGGQPAKLIRSFKDMFKREYDVVLDDVFVDTTRGIHKPVSGVLENPHYNISDTSRAQLQRWVNARMPESVNSKAMPAAEFHKFRSAIRKEARRLSGTQTADAGAQAEMLNDLSHNLTMGLWKSADKLENVARLTELDTAYRNFAILDDAAASTMGGQKGLTPKVLATAARRAANGGRSTESGALQDIVAPAARIMQEPGGVATGMDLARVGAVAGGAIYPPALAAVAPVALGSTRVGAKAMFGQYPKQAIMRRARVGPGRSALAGAVAAEYAISDKEE